MKPVHRPTDTGLQVQVNRRLADLERRQGTTGLPSQRFWIDPGDDFSGGLGASSLVSGAYTSTGHANLTLSSGDTDLAHWDAGSPLSGDGGGNPGAVIIDQAGYYLVTAVCNLQIDGYITGSTYPSNIWVEAMVQVNNAGDTVDYQKVSRACDDSLDALNPSQVPVPLHGGTKAFAAGDALGIWARARIVEDPGGFHMRFAWGDGEAVGGLNTYLELTLVG
jgi:hypothetical protein